MNLKPSRTILMACAALAGATTHAAILGVTGFGVHETDLTQVGYTANYFDDPTTAAPIHFWNEKHDVELTAAIDLVKDPARLTGDLLDLGYPGQQLLHGAYLCL